MTIKITPLLLSFMLISSVKSQTISKKSFSDIATIYFPKEPAVGQMNAQDYYSLEKDSVFYFAVMIDGQSNRKMNTKFIKLDSIYAGYIKGFTKSINSDLSPLERYYIKGFRGVQTIISFPSKYGSTATGLLRVIYLNEKLFSYFFASASTDKKRIENDGIKFLGTFTLNKDPKDINQ